MEVLLAACLLAWAAGAQSEQARLGISPAQRAVMREEVRHRKAIQRIAEKHGATPTTEDKRNPEDEPSPVTIQEAFRSGYRQQTLVERAATPLGRRAGGWAAQGVAWTRDTGRGALREYRKRRKAVGQPDPAPVLIPMPPSHPPTVSLVKPPKESGPKKPPVELAPMAPPPNPAPQAPAAAEAKPEAAAQQKPPAPIPAPRLTQEATPTTPAENGVGRMAAEVSYESVLDESDELSAMCEDDLLAYGRIRDRCEREIGRADELIAQLKSPGMQVWIGKCAEQYRVILAQLDDLKDNTLAQSEAVVKAKALLESGQGFYAEIAADMETVEDREFYVSDQVDGEDANAESETYETKGA